MRALSNFHEAEPEQLEWLADGSIGIRWEDGTRFEYRRTFLREHCPCATCKGTHGPPTTQVKEVLPPPSSAAPAAKKASFAIRSGPKPPPVSLSTQLVSAEPVGAYAMRFHWGDGHGSGIYSWRYLRFLGEVIESRADAADFG